MISSKSSRLYKRLMRLRPIICGLNRKLSRLQLNVVGAFSSRALRKCVVFTPEPFALFKAEWASPAGNPRKGVILYLHGGGYMMGSMTYARAFGGLLSDRVKRTSLCIAYRLAPEHPFPAALDDAAEAYLRLRERYPDQPVALVGESAGGGLCFALACRLRELRMSLPDCIVALSPWTDLTGSGASCQTQAAHDPCLSPKLLRRAARWYAGDDIAHPLASPLFADLSDMPPAQIYVGTREMLLDDAVRMAERYRQAGSSCELHVARDMWHVYPLYATPESEEALGGVDAFLNAHLSPEDKLD